MEGENNIHTFRTPSLCRKHVLGCVCVRPVFKHMTYLL